MLDLGKAWERMKSMMILQVFVLTDAPRRREYTEYLLANGSGGFLPAFAVMFHVPASRTWHVSD